MSTGAGYSCQRSPCFSNDGYLGRALRSSQCQETNEVSVTTMCALSESIQQNFRTNDETVTGWSHPTFTTIPCYWYRFCWPIPYQKGNLHKPVNIKSCVCLFVCCRTQSIHLDLCSEIATSCMMAALTRFGAKRGLPAKIQMDNGSNFLGASRELAQCYNLLASAEFHDAATRLHS